MDAGFRMSGEQQLGGLDVETMKLALRIIFSEEDQLSGWLKRAPRRPWYARNLKLARDQLRR